VENPFLEAHLSLEGFASKSAGRNTGNPGRLGRKMLLSAETLQVGRFRRVPNVGLGIYDNHSWHGFHGQEDAAKLEMHRGMAEG